MFAKVKVSKTNVTGNVSKVPNFHAFDWKLCKVKYFLKYLELKIIILNLLGFTRSREE